MRVGDLLSERFFVICDDGREGGSGSVLFRDPEEIVTRSAWTDAVSYRT